MEKHKSQRSESANTMPVRVAYVFAHEKRTKRANGSPMPTPRYDATLLVPKTNPDPAQCSNYQWFANHCMAAATKAWGSWPAGGYWPIQDGDAPPKPKAPIPGQPVAPVDPAKYAWRKGHWLVEVTNFMDPGPRVAIMQGGQALEIPARVVNGKTMYKSGDYAIVHIHAYTFQNEKFGVNFGFEGILFVGEGEAIGSSGPRSAAQMFGQVAPVAQMPIAPQLAYQPPAAAPVVPPAMPALPTSAPAAPAPIASTAYAPSPGSPAPQSAPAMTAYPSSAPVPPPPATAPVAPVAATLPPFPVAPVAATLPPFPVAPVAATLPPFPGAR